MCRLLESFGTITMAKTFTEAGEWEIAKKIMAKKHQEYNQHQSQPKQQVPKKSKRPRMQL